MIAQMLRKENIQILDQVADWQEAVRVSVKPLVQTGFVEPRYADGIIENARELGPYFVLTDDVALLHGRPEQGVIEKQLAVTVVHKSVDFSGDKSRQARLLVTLAATNGEDHIDVMATLAELFMNEEKIRQVINSKSAEEVYQIFLAAEEAALE